MPKRSTIVVAALAVFFLWGFGWPLLTIYLNQCDAKRVQGEIISQLEARFPDRTFEPQGAHGYTNARFGIRVLGDVGADEDHGILEFLTEQNLNPHFRFKLRFESDDNGVRQIHGERAD